MPIAVIAGDITSCILVWSDLGRFLGINDGDVYRHRGEVPNAELEIERVQPAGVGVTVVECRLAELISDP